MVAAVAVGASFAPVAAGSTLQEGRTQAGPPLAGSCPWRSSSRREGHASSDKIYIAVFLSVFVSFFHTSVCPFCGPAFPACLWSTFARTLTLTLAWCLGGGGGGGGGCCCHCCCFCVWDPGVFALIRYDSVKKQLMFFSKHNAL